MLGKKEQKALELISEDLDYSNYFFRKVKDPKWFYPLKERGYFDPIHIRFDSEGRSYFWNVLDYLERISEQVEANPEYCKELLEIVNNIVQYSRGTKKIDNHHIWWFCVKIINNIPTNLIVPSLEIATFKVWLLEWTDPALGSDLAISDISKNLLKKFIDNDNTVSFAETIIEIITRVRPSEKKGAFDKKEDAALVWDPYWILDAFKNYVKEIGEKCPNNTIYDIANKLRKSLEFKQKDTYVNIKIDNNFYQLKILRMPEENIGENEISFKESIYECVLKKYTTEQIKGSDIEGDFWALHRIDPQELIKAFPMEASSKDIFISKLKEKLPNEIEWNKEPDFEKKVNQLYDGLSEDYSQVWFKSMKEGGSDHANRAEEILTIILRDVVLAKCEAQRLDGQQIIEKFLSDDFRFPVFKKICLICIDKYWEDYSELFTQFVEKTPDILNRTDWEVELQDLLRAHNNNFDEDLVNKLVELIENVPEYYLKEGGKYEAYWRYKWLSPLKDNPAFSEPYEKAKEDAEEKEVYKPERSAIKGGFVSHQSPLTKEEILSMPLNDIVKFLNEFKGADFWGGTFEGEPDKEGLADTLQAAVKEEPLKFNDEIELFRAAPYGYVHKMLWGLRDAWREGKDLAWEKLFNFSFEYINRKNFLQKALRAQGSDSGDGKYLWVVDSIIELIEDGSRKDERAFDKKYFPIVDNIFDSLMPLLKGERDPDTQRDAVTYAMNTTLGRAIESFIIYSLRVARVRKKEGKEKEKDWGKNKYDRFFNKGIDAYVWLGRYLPNIKFIDESFVEQKVQEMAEREINNHEWQNFMEAYLTGHVYEDLYKLMRANYLKAIDSKVFEGRADNSLIHHIAIGYLRGYENLEEKNEDQKDSLFWKLLMQIDVEEKKQRWLEVVRFFWSISGRKKRTEEDEKISEENKTKILKFWEFTVEKQTLVNEKLGDEYPSFLGQLGELTVLLDRIDSDKYEWLMLSAPYVESLHRSSFFIEYLTKFEDKKSLKYIAKIYLKMLENSTPIFKSEDIQTIVKRLYELGKEIPEVKSDADAICNTYGRRGTHILKDIFYKYQNNK